MNEDHADIPFNPMLEGYGYNHDYLMMKWKCRILYAKWNAIDENNAINVEYSVDENGGV
jgi:hypothetical protein